MMIKEETYNLPYDSKVDTTQKLLKTIPGFDAKKGHFIILWFISHRIQGIWTKINLFESRYLGL